MTRARLWLAAVPLAVFAAVRAVAICRAPPRLLVALTPDDAYYYFGIARNLALGLGSTFDGLTHTNGYQPLWMGVLTVLARVLPGDRFSPDGAWLLPRVAISLQMFFGLAGLGLVARALREAAGEWAAALFLIGACNPATVYSLCDGMESGMVLLALGVLVTWFVHFAPGRAPWLGGAALLCLALARLDLALVTALTTVVVWRAAGPRAALKLAAIPCVGLALYAGANLELFGLPLPISVLAKSSFPHPVWRPEELRHNAVFFAVALGGAAVSLRLSREAQGVAGLRPFFVAGGLFAALHAAASALFMHFGLYQWHFVFSTTAALMAGAVALARVLESRRVRPGLVPAMGLVLVLGACAECQWWFFGLHESRAFQAGLYDAGVALRGRLGPQSILGFADAGILGYVLGGRVIDLDGLAADRHYRDTVHRDGLAAYAKEVGMTHIGIRLDPVMYPTDQPLVFGMERFFYGEDPSEIPLPPEKLFYQTPPYPTLDGPETFALYAL